jgi:short-subunit dehydrogenase
MRTLFGKRALVTGGASGIGRAIAIRLAREGTDLCLVDIDQDGLAETETAAAKHGIRVLTAICDLSDPQALQATVEKILAIWGHVDLLVNNAGIAYYGPTSNMTSEQWDRLLAINLLAPIQLTRQLLPILLRRPDAHILNVASMLGLVATQRAVAYQVSKFGLVGFSEGLRAEFCRQGLGVTCLCPGFVRTRLFDTGDWCSPRRPPAWLMASPEQVAERAVHGILHNKRLVIVTWYAKLLHLLKRLAPGLLDGLHLLGRARALRKKQQSSAEGRPGVYPVPMLDRGAA